MDFKGLLRKSGFKATKARLAVLTAMKHSKKPLSPQGIIQAVEKNFDQATVYRTIANLKVKGIIKQIDLRHNHAHYELAGTEDHHHLVCMHCGRVENIAGCEVEEMYKEILSQSRHFSQIHQHTLEFFGLCANCNKTGI